MNKTYLFSDEFVAELRTDIVETIYRDKKIGELSLRVSVDGSKIFAARYGCIRQPLGLFPHLRVEGARRLTIAFFIIQESYKDPEWRLLDQDLRSLQRNLQRNINENLLLLDEKWKVLEEAFEYLNIRKH